MYVFMGDFSTNFRHWYPLVIVTPSVYKQGFKNPCNTPMNFFGKFSPFCENYHLKKYFVTNSLHFFNKISIMIILLKKSQKITIIS
jgi:hypothetical protein